MARPAGSPVSSGSVRWEGVSGHAVADDLGVDVGSALESVLQLLQHQHPAALSHDEAVAPGIERTAGSLRLVVARG